MDAPVDDAAPVPGPDGASSPDVAPATLDGGTDGASVDTGEPEAGGGDRPADRGGDRSPDAGPELALTIGAFETSGELCPDGSVVVNPAATAFTLVFSDATFAGEGGTAAISRTCRVAIELGVPAGYQFSSARFISRGVVLSDEGAPSTILFDNRYSFEGPLDSVFFSSDLTGSNDDFEIVRRPVDLWSPSCSVGASRVRLLIDVTASVQGGTDLFALDALDGAFTVPEGLEWRRCGELEPIRPSPSPKGGSCDGVNKLPCAFGLACEFSGENVELGSCVNPTEMYPPQPNGERCGGYRGIPCAGGLVCMFATSRSVVEKRLGFCTPTVGAERDSCGGYPPISCLDGLTCNPQGKRCVRDSGELGAPCGEGLRACNAGLACNGSTCVVQAASEGQPCGGPLAIVCRRPLVCRTGTCGP